MISKKKCNQEKWGKRSPKMFFFHPNFEDSSNSTPKSNSCQEKCFQDSRECNRIGDCSAPFKICSFDAFLDEHV